MSVMCKMNNQCSQKKGLCSHETMMLAVMAAGVLAAIGHWVLGWF
ncbi:MAG: hypothetical protein PHW13_00570 [Methylococcales bacterium]|nr:hypothetical protein [Methylococcales bacterium]